MPSNTWEAREYAGRFGFVSRLGDELLDLLHPLTGERILDLGCGNGRHAGAVAARGASVIGIDLDESMLALARQEHPGLVFVRADATDFGLAELGTSEPFDGCLSNAALHWMVPQEAVLANVRSVLLPGGRFVAEMGGAGNIAALDTALRSALLDLDLMDVDVPANYFPTVGQQASALEAAGFRVELASWFRRATPLPDSTPADWTRQFRADTWMAVPAGLHGALAERVDRHAHTNGLHTASGWVADYCRLRFAAIAA